MYARKIYLAGMYFIQINLSNNPPAHTLFQQNYIRYLRPINPYFAIPSYFQMIRSTNHI